MGNVCKRIFMAVVPWTNWYLGGFDEILISLAVFMAISFLTDAALLFANQNLCCEALLKRIFMKILILMMVGIGNILDQYILTESHVLRAVVILFYLSFEGKQILWNAIVLGLPVPGKLVEILERLGE